MIIALIIFFAVYVLYLVMDHYNTLNMLKESHKKIMDNINTVLDGVKTFFTITLIDSIASAFDSTPDDTDENSDEI